MKRILALLGLLYASTAVWAQQTTPPRTRSTQCHHCTRKLIRRTVLSPIAPSAPPSQAIDFFVGEAKVDVTKDETVVRLAMAQHGSVLIELPANDGPRYIIPGDPEMATVDEKALERNKRAIVVRPGSLFIASVTNRKTHAPAATVTVQMRSGLVVTFLFYPVEDLAQNVHRCVLSYNRDEVVARRRAAGLPVNLDNLNDERRNETGQSTAPTSISVEVGEDKKPSTQPSITIQLSDKTQPQPEPAANNTLPNLIADKTAPNSIERTAEPSEGVLTKSRDALARAIKKPKQFKGWTKSLHGLSLAAVQQADPKDDFKVLVIAVKNASNDELKILGGNPDLSLEMLDDSGKPINVQTLKQLHVEASQPSGAIVAGATVYYAIAYAPPVLGVRQQLKVLVGQTNAADEPASITISK
jgi:hypothetical protein